PTGKSPVSELSVRIVNVFTQNRGPLTGNPLCVFESGTSLDTATMQALAQQFNLSETTFVLPSSRATAQVPLFTGNPLCVFESRTSLDTATMQALARQFNLSETTFVLPSSRATAQVRIFTP